MNRQTKQKAKSTNDDLLIKLIIYPKIIKKYKTKELNLKVLYLLEKFCSTANKSKKAKFKT